MTKTLAQHLKRSMRWWEREWERAYRSSGKQMRRYALNYSRSCWWVRLKEAASRGERIGPAVWRSAYRERRRDAAKLETMWRAARSRPLVTPAP